MEYVVNEEFLESVRKNAGRARGKGGINTPSPAVDFVQVQLLAEMNDNLKTLISLISSQNAKTETVEPAKVTEPAPAKIEEKPKATK